MKERKIVTNKQRFGIVVGISSSILSVVFLSSLFMQNPVAQAIILSTAVLGTGFVLFKSYRQLSKPLSHEQKLSHDVKPVAETMQICLQQRRLHRELHPASLELLEACALQWNRVRSAFAAPFWERKDLPIQYSNIRNQTLMAAELTMMEVVLIYRNQLPSTAKQLSWGKLFGYVEDTLLQAGIGNEINAHLPPEYETVRAVAGKMQVLADEADQTGRSMIEDTDFLRISPTFAVDQSIHELKTLRNAEDELRIEIGNQDK